jgi:hypothetical protein
VLRVKANVQHVVLFHHFRGFLEAAAKEGIDAAPLKGAHVVTSVYPEGEDRGVMADVDFLVRERDWERTLALLPRLGFAPRAGWPGYPDEPEMHEAGFTLDLGGGRKILFEAHRFLVEPRRFFIDHEALWARSFPSDFEGVACRRLAPEDHVLFIAFHEAMHRLQNLGRAVRDLELLARAGADLDVVAARACSWRMRRIAWLFLSLLGEHGRAKSLAPPLPVRAAIRMLVPDARATRLGLLPDRLQAAALYPLLFDDVRMLGRYVAAHPALRR